MPIYSTSMTLPHSAKVPASTVMLTLTNGCTGWAEAVLVSSSIDAYYPLGSAACCTPSLLLESGSAWELERCDCVQSGDTNCGGMSTHRFLTGFDHWR